MSSENLSTTAPPSLETIESEIKLIDVKKAELKKAFDDLQANSNHLSSFCISWPDIDSHFTALRDSVTQRFRTLESHDSAPNNPTQPQHRVDSVTDSVLNQPLTQPDPVPLNAEKPSCSNSLPLSCRTDLAVARPELKGFCERMDGKGLRKYIFNRVKEQLEAIRIELPAALKSAPDPGAMVLDAMEGFYHVNFTRKDYKNPGLFELRKVCVVLLEQLMETGLSFREEVRERAKMLALEWKEKPKLNKGNSLETLAFLQLVATYSLGAIFDKEELVDYIFSIIKLREAATLFRAIGLGEKVHDLIQKMLDNGKRLFAVRFIFEFGLVEKFPPVPLLDEHLKEKEKLTKQVCRDGNNSLKSQNAAAGREIFALKCVIKIIEERNLEKEYSPEPLQKRIEQLENEQADRKSPAMPSAPNPPQQQQPQQQASQSAAAQQAKKKNKLSPGKQQQSGSKHPKTASSFVPPSAIPPFQQAHHHPAGLLPNHSAAYSSPAIPFGLQGSEKPSCSNSLPPSGRTDLAVALPELKEFCERMDGKRLRKYVFDRIKEQREAIRIELPAALKSAPDPGAIVLDAIEGFYDVILTRKDDKEPGLFGLRKVCLLLLEQLMETGLSFGEEVTERAKMLALEWKVKVKLLKDNYCLETSVFLQLVATYSLGAMFDKDELVDYIFSIPKFRKAAALCRAIGLGYDLIQKLLDNGKRLSAVRFIFEFGLTEKFPHVPLLDEDLKEIEKLATQICRDGNNSPKSQNKAICKEIGALKFIKNIIEERNLETEYSPDPLQKRIEQLEKEQADRKSPAMPSAPNPPQQQQQQQASQSAAQQAKKKNKQSPGKQQQSGNKHPKTAASFVPPSAIPPYQQAHHQPAGLLRNHSAAYSSPAIPFGLQGSSPFAGPSAAMNGLAGALRGFLVNPIPAAPPLYNSVPPSDRTDLAVTRPELKEFCERMDGKGLMKYVFDHIKEQREAILIELPAALKSAPDPGTMVLDAMEGFHFKGLIKVRVFLLEQLMETGLSFGEEVTKRAKMLALEWKVKVKVKDNYSLETLAFLQLVATYSLGAMFDKDELVDYFFSITKLQQAATLCRAIGLGYDLIQKMLDNGKRLFAVRFIFELGLTEKFPHVPLLDEYMKETEKLAKQICRDGNNSLKSQNKAICKEIGALKFIKKIIEERNLETEYSPEPLQKRIEQLEKKQADMKSPAMPSAPNPPQQQQSAGQQAKKKNKLSPGKQQQSGNKHPKTAASFVPLAIPPFQQAHHQPASLLPNHTAAYSSPAIPFGLQGSSPFAAPSAAMYGLAGAPRGFPVNPIPAAPPLYNYGRPPAYGAYNFPPQYRPYFHPR